MTRSNLIRYPCDAAQPPRRPTQSQPQGHQAATRNARTSSSSAVAARSRRSGSRALSRPTVPENRLTTKTKALCWEAIVKTGNDDTQIPHANKSKRPDLTSHKHPSQSTGYRRDNEAVFLHKTTHRHQLNQSQTPVNKLRTTMPQEEAKKCICKPEHEGVKARHRRTQQMMTMLQNGTPTQAVKNPAREIEHTTQGMNAKPRQNGWRENNQTCTKHFAGPFWE